MLAARVAVSFPAKEFLPGGGGYSYTYAIPKPFENKDAEGAKLVGRLKFHSP